MDPYQSPEAAEIPADKTMLKPPVYIWYKVYCAVMLMMYLIVGCAGAGILLFAPNDLFESELEKIMLGTIYSGMGFFLTIPYAIGLIARPAPWHWIYGLVLIALGMTSCACLPATIPLLIFWLRPDLKAYMGSK